MYAALHAGAFQHELCLLSERVDDLLAKCLCIITTTHEHSADTWNQLLSPGQTVLIQICDDDGSE